MEPSASILSSTLLLDRVGDVLVTLNPDGLSWKSLDTDASTSYCLGLKIHSMAEADIKFSNIYGVEYIDWGSIHDVVFNPGEHLFHKRPEMHRFVVHGFHKGRFHHSPWVLSAYTFGHKDLLTCRTWVEKLNSFVNMESGRPRSLMVFVHPLCGKGNGRKTWETVAPIFSRANVQTKVMVTQRAGHAYDVLTSSTDRELSLFDGIIAVGGDGLFNEIINGLLSSRHKFSNPPIPNEFNLSGYDDQNQQSENNSKGDQLSSNNNLDDVSVAETSHKNDDQKPLLSPSETDGLDISNRTDKHGPENSDHDPVLSFPNDWFRLGIIPAGSTDSIVISTTGVRDPVTSALHIVLGKRILLDVAQVVKWRTSPSSKDVPSVRYAASFIGYGFYGDVIKDSEKCRWMGPKRYDYSGTKVFLEHRSYEAEITYLDPVLVNPLTGIGTSGNRTQQQICQENEKKIICRVNCTVCNMAVNYVHIHANDATTRSSIGTDDSRWLRSKGRFLSVGAAIISNRNEKAPDGLVADAHLADGFLHLILIKDCPRPFYLWHLIQLTKKGGTPLNFKFVEHHKTSAFTFVSPHDESVWNLDGELFQASKLSARVYRGLINLFASGPEV